MKGEGFHLHGVVRTIDRTIQEEVFQGESLA